MPDEPRIRRPARTLVSEFRAYLISLPVKLIARETALLAIERLPKLESYSVTG